MMQKEVDRYYNNYKSGIVFLLAVSGLWPNCKKHSESAKKCLTVIAVFAESAVTFGIVNFCVQNLTNINVLTRGLGLMISFSSALIKALVMVIYRADVIKLNRTLSHQFEKDLTVAENRPLLLAHYPSFHRYFRLHSYYTGAVIVLMIIGPISALRHGKYIRAYPQLIPFAYESGGWIHWAIYGFELVEGWYCWTNTVGVDSLFGLYALHMVGQLRLLAHRFRSLKPGANYKEQLKDCVDRHASLIESKHLMEKIFGFLSIWLAVTCAIVICAIIFQSSQSEACLDSIYYASWAGQGDLRLMNDVLIILSQNPMHFQALSVMIVRMDMFSKIMNTSVSYFFLLKTLDAKLETS